MDIHNHRMAVEAKLTEKPYATAVREKHLQCGYESHQVTKLLWCRWWTGGCAVMSYLAAVARCDCSHLLQVVSTSDRPTSTQTLWAQAKSSHRPFTVIMTSLHHHQTSRRGTDSLSATQKLCSIQSQTRDTPTHYIVTLKVKPCHNQMQHDPATRDKCDIFHIHFHRVFILTSHDKTVFLFVECYLTDTLWIYQPRRASRMQTVTVVKIFVTLPPPK